MVFGARLAEAILGGTDGPAPTGVMGALLDRPVERVAPGVAAPWATRGAVDPAPAVPTWPDVTKTRDRLQRLMIEGAGVVRSAASLGAAGVSIDALGAEVGTATPPDRAHGEVANLITAATSVLRAATVRAETRGAHARSDHPEASERWRRRIVHDTEGLALVDGPGHPGIGATGDRAV
jgi:aspartate oxidase